MNTSLPNLIPLAENPTNGHKHFTVAILFIIPGVISTVLVSIRLVYNGLTRYGPEDFALIPGFMMYVVWASLVVYTNFEGSLGVDAKDMTFKQIQITYRTTVISLWLYSPITTLIRVSILLFYKRLFASTISAIAVAIWVLLVMQVLFCLVLIILPAVRPTPLSLLWDPHRIPGNTEFYAWYSVLQMGTYIVSLVFDVAIFILPIFPIVSLRLPILKRVTTGLIFLIGAGACFAAAWKLQVFFTTLNFRDNIPLRYEAELYMPPRYKSGEAIWYSAFLEPTLGLSGSSLPAVRNLVRSIRGRAARSRGQPGMNSRPQHHVYWLRNLRHARSSECGLTGDYSDLSDPSDPSDHSGDSHSDQSHSGYIYNDHSYSGHSAV